MPEPQTPQFRHSCTSCRFLGRSHDGTHDLYYCPMGHSFVARWGNSGTLPNEEEFSDRDSMDTCTNPYLLEAHALHQAQVHGPETITIPVQYSEEGLIIIDAPDPDPDPLLEAVHTLFELISTANAATRQAVVKQLTSDQAEARDPNETGYLEAVLCYMEGLSA